MSQLIVRNLDRKIVQALKLRAAKVGRSAEAEHRAILEAVLGGTHADLDFKGFLLAMPDPGPLQIRRSKDRGRKVRL
jgi:plasmid stability protein